MRSFLLLLLLPAALCAQTPPKTKQVPPKGVEIPAADRTELEQGVAALRVELDKIDAKQANKPDAEIYLKAVDWALRYDEFFNVKEVAAAKKLLAEGMTRAAALQKGEAPWTTATGAIVRGFRSRLDGSVQPYGVVVPAVDQRLRPLWVFNHGRGETVTELNFISGRTGKVGDLAPADTFVVHPFGRFCNATKFAGETDVFEALEAAQKAYKIDPKRIAMTGFSMGGASTWHLSSHYAWRWAAASPGAGFAETQIYTKALADGKEPPPWWEQKLWSLYNATDVAANLANTHLIAYSGEIDPQKASADLMEKAMADAGLKLERLIGPQTAHKYEPATKEELIKRLQGYVQAGTPAIPSQVTLVTYTLKYNRQAWVEVDALQEHWKRAELWAWIDGSTLTATTSNMTGVSFHFNTPPSPALTKIILDGQEFASPVTARDGRFTFQRPDKSWVNSAPAKSEKVKRHDSQGPIDDAFMSSFVFVRPTGTPLQPEAAAWLDQERERAKQQWRTVFRGDVREVDDRDVTPEMTAANNLILWGDPGSNSVLAKIVKNLPLKWKENGLTMRGHEYPAGHVPLLIYPNPARGDRYVVLNSSFTFRQGSNTSNAVQTPKLPDWAVIDIRNPQAAVKPDWPAPVVDAGFFDEQWKVKPKE